MIEAIDVGLELAAEFVELGESSHINRRPTANGVGGYQVDIVGDETAVEHRRAPGGGRRDWWRAAADPLQYVLFLPAAAGLVGRECAREMTASASAVAEPVAEEAAPAARPKAAPKTNRQPRYHVVLWNDDDHTYQYVVSMLRKLFAHPFATGLKMAREVDTKGRVVVLTTTREHAELKRDQIHAFGADRLLARSKGSMSASIEPEAG